MKRKLLIAINIILILIALKLLYSIVINSILVNKYENGEYSESLGSALTVLNFPESYIAHYNYGNVLYKNGKYDLAMEEYEKALKGEIPEYNECNIRINYALAICKTVQVDEKNQDSIKKAINTYLTAIDILTEDGCANKKDNNGHSKDAEQLKQDIIKEIERLKNLLNSDEDKEKDDEDNEENDEKNEQDSEETQKDKEIEAQIKNIKEEATKEQRETESRYEHTGDFDFNKPTRNW